MSDCIGGQAVYCEDDGNTCAYCRLRDAAEAMLATMERIGCAYPAAEARDLRKAIAAFGPARRAAAETAEETKP